VDCTTPARHAVAAADQPAPHALGRDLQRARMAYALMATTG